MIFDKLKLKFITSVDVSTKEDKTVYSARVDGVWIPMVKTFVNSAGLWGTDEKKRIYLLYNSGDQYIYELEKQFKSVGGSDKDLEQAKKMAVSTTLSYTDILNKWIISPGR